MTDQTIHIDTDGTIATVTLNRPQSFNALNADLRKALRDTIGALDMQPDIRVVVLRGAGPGFCAGADLTERRTNTKPTHQLIEEEYRPILTGIAASPKIWIAQIHGSAAGIGAALAMTCDLVTIADNASIYMAFAAIGLVPDGGNCWLLLRGMGYHRALQTILEGRKIPAQEAATLGLANEVHSPDALSAKTMDLAKRIAAGAPLATAAAKRLMRQMDGMSFTDAILAEGLEQSALTQSDDFAEGVAAFIQKRRPNFT